MQDNSPTTAELVDEANGWAVGGGVVTMALFPLAIPLLALTVVAVIPLLVIGLAAGLVAAVVAAPILLLVRLARAIRRLPRPTRSVPTPSH
jgi:hypothetical protein